MGKSQSPDTAWLKNIFDSTSDLIWTVDTERFGLLSWNRAVEKYYAELLRREVRVGLTATDLAPGKLDFISSWDRRYRRVLDEGPFTEIYSSAVPFLVLEISFNRIEDHGTITGISVFGRNISEQAKAQQTLKENELWFRTLFDQSADAIFLNGLDGRVLRVNDEACRRLGYSAEELVSLRVQDFQTPENRPMVTNHIANLLAHGHLMTEVIHQSRDGKKIPTEVHSRIVEIDGTKRILSVARDITARKQVQEAFEESQTQYKLLFENSGSSNSLWSTDLRVVLANSAFSEMVGRPATEVAGLSVEEIFGPEAGPLLRHRAEEVMADGKSRVYDSNMLVGGKQGWFQTTYCALRGPGNQNLGVQVITHDLTEHHRLTDRVAQSEKLESIGILAGGIAHDFNNLLAGLSGHLELARLHLEEDEPAEALVRLNKAAGVFERAKALTQQLLTFSKGGTPIRSLQNLGPLIRDWAGFALSGTDLSVEFYIAQDLWPCECDNNQIGQVVDNLLINARQASPPGGTITIRAENFYADSAPHIQISITDQGPGIDPQIQKKIFTPFFTTKTNGTGLGLATSLSIISQHQGRIEVLSEPGRGTSLMVFLPAKPNTDASRNLGEPDSFQGSGWALIMDDEESLRDTLGEMVAAMGFSVLRARDGRDALAFYHEATQLGRPVTVALLDLTIPGGNGGFETAQKLRALGSSAVLVAISGYSEESGKVRESKFFDGFLSKPFSKTELVQLLKRLLRK